MHIVFILDFIPLESITQSRNKEATSVACVLTSRSPLESSGAGPKGIPSGQADPDQEHRERQLKRVRFLAALKEMNLS